MEQQKIITITMEEYKELLIIKGKYEELKSQQQPFYTGIRFNGEPVYKKLDADRYEVTCNEGRSVYEG